MLQVAFSSSGGRPMIFGIMGGMAALVVDVGSCMFKACFASDDSARWYADTALWARIALSLFVVVLLMAQCPEHPGV